MTQRIMSMFVVAVMAVAMTVALMLNDPREATAEDTVEAPAPVECHIQKNPPAIVCVQDGIPILSSAVDMPTQTVTVPVIPTLPPLPVITRFIKVETTITKPPVIKVAPGPTKTLPGPTVTAQPLPAPTVTVTRQPPPDDGTVEPADPDDGVLTLTEKILSVLALTVAAVVAGVLMLWFGFVLGYRSCDRNNQRFWTALRRQLFGKR